VRRAKLDSANQGENLVMEALARHQIPSVALFSLPITVKRTQGDDGPQCESMKGLSPEIRRIVDADTVGVVEGKTKRAHRQGSGGSTGVGDRSTSSR